MALAPRKKLWSTPSEVIEKSISLLNLSEDDIVYDVGAGDGKVIFQIQKQTKAHVKGIEIDGERVELIKATIKDNNLKNCEIILGNALDIEYSDATAFFLYLVPRGLRLILRKLQSIKRNNIRIVTYMSPLPGVSARQIHKVKTDLHPEAEWPLYYYVFDNLDNPCELAKSGNDNHDDSLLEDDEITEGF